MNHQSFQQTVESLYAHWQEFVDEYVQTELSLFWWSAPEPDFTKKTRKAWLEFLEKMEKTAELLDENGTYRPKLQGKIIWEIVNADCADDGEEMLWHLDQIHAKLSLARKTLAEEGERKLKQCDDKPEDGKTSRENDTEDVNSSTKKETQIHIQSPSSKRSLESDVDNNSEDLKASPKRLVGLPQDQMIVLD
jgi:hypothetical protein